MKRGKFILTALALYPLSTFSKMVTTMKSITANGFKVNACEARFGIHYKMKGVTLNMLDVKISSKDTNGELEQNCCSFAKNGYWKSLPIFLYVFRHLIMAQSGYIRNLVLNSLVSLTTLWRLDLLNYCSAKQSDQWWNIRLINEIYNYCSDYSFFINKCI